MSDSGIIPSHPSDDSENYEANNELSDSPAPSSSSSPMILYKPPTIWGLLRGAAINIFLPFVNGLMLGFGELFAHELAFQFGWSGTKVSISMLLQLLGWILQNHRGLQDGIVDSHPIQQIGDIYTCLGTVGLTMFLDISLHSKRRRSSGRPWRRDAD